MENPRTTSARDHDDSAMIDAIEPGPAEQGGSGNSIGADLASQAELDAVRDPADHERVTKEKAIDHGQAIRSERARGA